MVALLIVLLAQTSAADAPLREVPTGLSSSVRGELEQARAAIKRQMDAYNERRVAFLRECNGLPRTDPKVPECDRRFAALSAEQNDLRTQKQSFSARVDAVVAASVNTDSRVVDTRGVEKLGAEWMAKVPELANSPEAERIRKGFAAVLAGDWHVALAWWQDALLRDRTNAALRRSVELAQWTIDYKAARARTPDSTPAQRQAAQGNFTTAFIMLIGLRRDNPTEADRAFQTFEHMYRQNPAYRHVRDAYLAVTGGRVPTAEEQQRWRNAEDLWLWNNIMNRR